MTRRQPPADSPWTIADQRDGSLFFCAQSRAVGVRTLRDTTGLSEGEVSNLASPFPKRQACDIVPRDEPVRDIVDDSFPASDPPSWTLGMERPGVAR